MAPSRRAQCQGVQGTFLQLAPWEVTPGPPAQSQEYHEVPCVPPQSPDLGLHHRPCHLLSSPASICEPRGLQRPMCPVAPGGHRCPLGRGRVLGALQGNIWGKSPAGSWAAGLSRQHRWCSGSLGEPGTAFCGLGGLGLGLPEPGCPPLSDEGLNASWHASNRWTGHVQVRATLSQAQEWPSLPVHGGSSLGLSLYSWEGMRWRRAL